MKMLIMFPWQRATRQEHSDVGGEGQAWRVRRATRSPPHLALPSSVLPYTRVMGANAASGVRR